MHQSAVPQKNRWISGWLGKLFVVRIHIVGCFLSVLFSFLTVSFQDQFVIWTNGITFSVCWHSRGASRFQIRGPFSLYSGPVCSDFRSFLPPLLSKSVQTSDYATHTRKEKSLIHFCCRSKLHTQPSLLLSGGAWSMWPKERWSGTALKIRAGSMIYRTRFRALEENMRRDEMRCCYSLGERTCSHKLTRQPLFSVACAAEIRRHRWVFLSWLIKNG